MCSTAWYRMYVFKPTHLYTSTFQQHGETGRGAEGVSIKAEINAHPLALQTVATHIMDPHGGSLFAKHRLFFVNEVMYMV